MDLTREQECEQMVETISGLSDSVRQKLHMPPPPPSNNTNGASTPSEICAAKMNNADKHRDFFKQMDNASLPPQRSQESVDEKSA